MKNNKNGLELRGDIWLHKLDRKYLGSDRVSLLEKIDEVGSITQAAKAVGLSYKSAWEHVNVVNNLADKPLVERLSGGRGGGGTFLTAHGKEVIRKFRAVQELHRKFLENLELLPGDSDGLF